MKSLNMQLAVVVCLMFALAAQAQEGTKPSSTALATASDASQAHSETIIPRLIKFSGTLLDEHGQALKGPVGVTFALYAQQTGGAALWLETQNIKPDASGNYTVLLGANTASGVPAELFVSGEARWLGIQVGEEPEHERILLVSVPYALKAGDAETLGGKPLSSFMLNEASTAGSSTGSAAVATSSTAGKTQASPGVGTKTSATPQTAACTSVTSDGTATAGSISQFTAPCNVQGSLMSQTTVNGFPGVNLAGNNAGLLLNGTGTHQVTVTSTTTGVSGRLGQDGNGFFFASDTNGRSVRFLTNNGTLNEWMRVTSAGNIGIGTQTPAQKLSVAGMIQSTTGGVMFPDTTVQSSAAITQAAADARYALLGATSNAFTGSISASSLSGSGAGLTNVNAAMLNGLASTAFAPASGSPSYVAKNGDTMTGALNVPALQTTELISGADSNGNGLNLSVKANDGLGNGGSLSISAGSGGNNSVAGAVNVTAGNSTALGGGAVNIKAGNGGPNTLGGDIVLTPGTVGFKAGTVRTPSEIRMGSESGTAEGPFVSGLQPGYQGLVVRRINSFKFTAGLVIARTDTMTLERDGTIYGFQIIVAPASGNFSIACLGLSSTTTVVGFTDSFASPTTTIIVPVFTQTDLLQFNCTFGNADGEGHVTEVNLLRFGGIQPSVAAGSTWVGTVTSTFNQ